MIHNNNQGVFLELLVTAKNAIIWYLVGYQHDILPDSCRISGTSLLIFYMYMWIIFEIGRLK